MAATTPITDANGWQAIFVLALREEMRSRTIAHLDALLEQLDAITDRQVAGIRTAGARLGIDPERIERDVDLFVQRHAGARDWFVRQRAAAVLGIPDLLIDPLQV